MFTSFLPGASADALKRMRKVVRGWRIHRQTAATLAELAKQCNPAIRGWWNYFGAFYRMAMQKLHRSIDRRLEQWARRKYKTLLRRKRRSVDWLRRMKNESPRLFYHWSVVGERLTASGKQGVPQGGVISPLLSNIYLTEVDRMLDRMLERAKETTRNGKYTYVEYARFADDLVVLIDAHPRNAWLLGAVNKRLREEFAKLEVEINEEKSSNVDLEHAESFGFLGFDFRRLRSMERQVWRAHYTPKMKKRTALLRKLKEVFRRFQSQPVDRVVQLINPTLRGWVNYFAVGHSSECFSFIQDWVEKKIRRHMGRSRKRRGFGWKRWSRHNLYEDLKLFNGYKVGQRVVPKVLPAQ
jgi:hypothetical protein